MCLVYSCVQGNLTDRAERGEGTRSHGVVSRTGPSLPGGFPQEMTGPDTTNLYRPTLHP